MSDKKEEGMPGFHAPDPNHPPEMEEHFVQYGLEQIAKSKPFVRKHYVANPRVTSFEQIWKTTKGMNSDREQNPSAGATTQQAQRDMEARKRSEAPVAQTIKDVRQTIIENPTSVTIKNPGTIITKGSV